jgi:ubiquinone/menaquinone biosynthesis C-methylase UbiE
MKIDFERERDWWDAIAHKEEQDRFDEAFNRALRWREIERHLDGVCTILEVGAATGVFSIPLAKRGFEITHFDISSEMLEIARHKAQGLENIRFVEGNAIDLSRFPDNTFDLVLNMDGAISFCGSEAEKAILETCRVTGRKLIISVSNRNFMVPIWLNASLKVKGKILPLVHAMLEHGEWHLDQFPENADMVKGMTQDYMGPLKAFLPGELRDILEDAGMCVLRCGGLGSLTAFLEKETLDRVQGDNDLFQQFLDLCEIYDGEYLPDGPGTRQRAGLIAVAERG